MKQKITWVDGMKFKATSESGHEMIIDGAPEIGGNNEGMRPMEMLLLSMAGCSAMDVIFILKKARQDVTDCEIEIDGTRADTIPKVFTDIHVHYILSGNNLDPKQVERAVNMSADKYCSVAQMMKKVVNVSHDHEIK
jgi:putative redox protein